METCNAQGHVVGMLDRDQRTAKIYSFDRHVVLVQQYCRDSREQTVLTRGIKTISHDSIPGRTSPHSSCKTRKNGHFWKSLHRLKHALVVGTYLSLISFPSILSAPTIRNQMSYREKSDPKWLNPCGMGGVNGAASEHRMPDIKLITQIIDQATIAEARAKKFKEDFVRKTFKIDFQQLNNYYKDKDYDWLPTKEIPKKLNQPVPREHLDSLEYKATLLNVYVYLQKIAVGLEQIVWDEKDRNGDFKHEFIQTEDYLRTLLCEIYTAIIENDLTVEDNVTREIMGQEFRNMDNTNMNVRNWIIYRDYLNMLEYVIQVFNHFKANLTE